MAELKWGSPEWRTHMRRSLAQRKRHGEKITDMEGLINYIEQKGPSKKSVAAKKPQQKIRSSITHTTQIVNVRSSRIRVL